MKSLALLAAGAALAAAPLSLLALGGSSFSEGVTVPVRVPPSAAVVREDGATVPARPHPSPSPTASPRAVRTRVAEEHHLRSAAATPQVEDHPRGPSPTTGGHDAGDDHGGGSASGPGPAPAPAPTAPAREHHGGDDHVATNSGPGGGSGGGTSGGSGSGTSGGSGGGSSSGSGGTDDSHHSGHR